MRDTPPPPSPATPVSLPCLCEVLQFPTAPLVSGYWYSVTRRSWLPAPRCFPLHGSVRAAERSALPAGRLAVITPSSRPERALTLLSAFTRRLLVCRPGSNGQLRNLQRIRIRVNSKHMLKKQLGKNWLVCLLTVQLQSADAQASSETLSSQTFARKKAPFTRKQTHSDPSIGVPEVIHLPSQSKANEFSNSESQFSLQTYKEYILIC